jgi:hypothetical protein
VGTKPDEALMDATTAIEFRPLSDDELAKWVAHHLSGRGVTIDERATELLCAATGNDLVLLAGEIDKLCSYTNGEPIDEAAVEAAADFLYRANMPLVYGLSNITCEAQREAVALAELIGGVVDSHTSL